MIYKLICVLLTGLLLFGCTNVPTEPSTTQTTQTPQPNETHAPTTPSKEPAPEPDPYRTLVEKMTLEQLVGQLFLARYPGLDSALEELPNYHIGGYILFGKDFEQETAASISAQLATLQNLSEYPLILATDEEGGLVARISQFSQFRQERFSTQRALYTQGGLSLVLQNEVEKCQLLASLGINVNMGPVCDITTDESAFMYDRSLGQDPETTGQVVSGIVEVMRQQKIGSVLKHFPGYGNNTDTHTAMAYDGRSLESLEAQDLIPFQSGIQAGCDAILVSHTVVACLDKTAPASLSPTVIAYLRENMGFDGVIVTDDLYMEAITDAYGVEESAVLAVLAGNDMLCSTEYARQYTAVLQAVNDGRISRSQVENSVIRILKWKHALGLLEL